MRTASEALFAPCGFALPARQAATGQQYFRGGAIIARRRDHRPPQQPGGARGKGRRWLRFGWLSGPRGEGGHHIIWGDKTSRGSSGGARGDKKGCRQQHRNGKKQNTD